MRRCAVSVDLDEIPLYERVHGLRPGAAGTDDLVHRVALPRFLELARDRAMAMTFFAVGESAGRHPDALREAVDAGHEVANHSASHRYDLSRQPSATLEAEVGQAHDAILHATGVAPVGFRAPGYVVSDALFDVLEKQGYRYDSSVFPCPHYQLGKLSVLAMMAPLGRRSSAVVDSPAALTAPRRPYRPGRPPWRRGQRELVELPIQVTPTLRLPVIGTTLTLAGPGWARWLARQVIGEPFVNLELHGLDLLEVADGLTGLTAVQPDARVGLERKRRSIEAFLDELVASGYDLVRLDEAAHLPLSELAA